MAQPFSEELLDKLTGFFVNSIAEKVFDGVTYIMVFNNEEKLFNAYNELRKDVDDLGYAKNACFRVFKFNNGYVFDLDLSLSIYIADKVIKENIKDVDGATKRLKESLATKIKDKRKEAKVSFAKYCVKQMNNGTSVFDVALFSRNTVPKIVISGKDKDGNNLMLQYKAFALRHWDLNELNSEELKANGLQITKIEPCEILPSRNGVRFRIHLAELI